MGLIDQITSAARRLGIGASTPKTGLEVRYVNGTLALYDPKLQTYIDDGYLSNEQVYSIIRWIIQKSVKVPFYLYEVKDEKSLKQYKSLLNAEGTTVQSMVTANIIRQKALVEVEGDTHPIQQWLQRPNPHQSWDEFLEYCYGFKPISGERFLYRVDGLPSKAPSVYPLNPADVVVEQGQDLYEIKRFLYGNERKELDKDKVAYSRYFNPSRLGGVEYARGLSPLRALLGVIQESNEGKKQSIKQMQNSGPVGAIYGNSDEATYVMPADLAQKLEDKVSKAWVTGQKRPIVTSSKIGFVRFGLSPVELGVLDSRKFTFRQLCDGYGLPVEIFNMGEGTTFNNKNEAKRSAIIDAVLPGVLSLRNDFNEILAPYLNPGSGKKYYIDCDPSDLPELQEDMEKMANVYKEIFGMAALTPNQVKAAFKWGTDDRPEMDSLMNYPMIPNGFTPWKLLESDPLDIDPATQTDIPQ